MAELLSTVYSAGLTIVRKLEHAKQSVDEGRELAARVSSALELLQEAVPAFEDDASFRIMLVQLKNLFEDIDDLLSLCLPPPPTSSVVRNVARHAKRVFFSEQHLQALKDFSSKLDSFLLDLSGNMHLVTKQQQNRMEQQQGRMEAQNNRLAGQLADGLRAIQITLAEGTEPSLKLAKRHLKGNLIEEELVESEEYLGSGSFGKVMAGEYYGKPVAIKRALKEVLSPEDRESFRREASTHFALRHDRIVQVIAFRTGDGSQPPCLVMERMDRTLYHFLGIKAARLDLAGCLAYIIDICEGIKYLHQSGVLHRDIKSHNILLHAGGAKVSDFGLAHVCSTIGRSTGNGRVLDQKAGTKFWMPPEARCYHLGPYSYDSEIFSLHVVMWEIVEHLQGGRVHEPEIGHLLLSRPTARLRLTRKEGATDSPTSRLHRLIRRCGSAKRDSRPRIGDALSEAKEIFDSLSGTGDGAGPGALEDSLRPVRETGGGSIRPSAARRRAQEDKASDSRGGSWEGWRELNVSVLVGAKGEPVQDPPGLHRRAGAGRPTGPPPAEEDRRSKKSSAREPDDFAVGGTKKKEPSDYQLEDGANGGDGTPGGTKLPPSMSRVRAFWRQASAAIDRVTKSETPKLSESGADDVEDGRAPKAASEHPPEEAESVDHGGTTDEQTGLQGQIPGLVRVPPSSSVGPRTAAATTNGAAMPGTNSAAARAGGRTDSVGVPPSSLGPAARPLTTRKKTLPEIVDPFTDTEVNTSDPTGVSGAGGVGRKQPAAPGRSQRIDGMSDAARGTHEKAQAALRKEAMPAGAVAAAAAKRSAAVATPATFAADAVGTTRSAAPATADSLPAAGSPVEVSFGGFGDATGRKADEAEASAGAKARTEVDASKAKASSDSAAKGEAEAKAAEEAPAKAEGEENKKKGEAEVAAAAASKAKAETAEEMSPSSLTPSPPSAFVEGGGIVSPTSSPHSASAEQSQVGCFGWEELHARMKTGKREDKKSVSFSSTVAEIPQRDTSWEEELEQSEDEQMPSSCGDGSPRLPSSSTLEPLSALAEDGWIFSPIPSPPRASAEELRGEGLRGVGSSIPSPAAGSIGLRGQGIGGGGVAIASPAVGSIRLREEGFSGGRISVPSRSPAPPKTSANDVEEGRQTLGTGRPHHRLVAGHGCTCDGDTVVGVVCCFIPFATFATFIGLIASGAGTSLSFPFLISR
eukprot:g2420.t2